MVAQQSHENQLAKLTFGITPPPVLREGFPVSHQDALTIDLARVGPIGPAEMATIIADGEIILSHLREHPQEMTAIFNHIAAGRREEAMEMAKRIGFTEEVFKQKSGGFWFYIIFVGTIIVANAAFAHPK
jgi:hypothetical protein